MFNAHRRTRTGFQRIVVGHIIIWVGGLILPALIGYGAGVSDHEEKDRINHYDSSGKVTGYTEVPTGRINKGSHETGLGCATRWVVGYLAYSVFYGWWH